MLSYRSVTAAPRFLRSAATSFASPFLVATIRVTVGAFFASASASSLASCEPSASTGVAWDASGAAVGAALAVAAPPATVTALACRRPTRRARRRSAGSGFGVCSRSLSSREQGPQMQGTREANPSRCRWSLSLPWSSL